MDKGLIMALEITKVCFYTHVLENYVFLNCAYISVTNFLFF